jgi:hypothetical protein
MMADISKDPVDDAVPSRTRLPLQLLVEILIGFGLAGVLVLVAWASSNAIRFVYGGY